MRAGLVPGSKVSERQIDDPCALIRTTSDDAGFGPPLSPGDKTTCTTAYIFASVSLLLQPSVEQLLYYLDLM